MDVEHGRRRLRDGEKRTRKRGDNLRKSRPWLDYDDCSLEVVLRDVLRLQEEFELGEADVFESSNSYLYNACFLECGVMRLGSWHVRFYEARPWSEVKKILDSSKCHEGFKFFSKNVGDITLRISDQEGSKPPEKVCTIDKKGVIKKCIKNRKNRKGLDLRTSNGSPEFFAKSMA